MNEEQAKKEFEKILPAIKEELEKNPPTIGLIGVSGVGKTSTINSLFKTNLFVSDTVAATKEFEETDIALKFNSGVAKDSSVQLRVVDAPGLGEDINLDPKYLQMYKDNLGKCDVILWVLVGRNRAIALDQKYLQELEEFHPKIVFGLNQIQLVEPLDWNEKYNIPSKKQDENIKIIIEDRKSKLASIVKREITMIEYSSRNGYKLEELFAALINFAPESRSWIFNGLKGFSYKDYTPKIVLDELEKRENKANNEDNEDNFWRKINPFK